MNISDKKELDLIENVEELTAEEYFDYICITRKEEDNDLETEVNKLPF